MLNIDEILHIVIRNFGLARQLLCDKLVGSIEHGILNRIIDVTTELVTSFVINDLFVGRHEAEVVSVPARDGIILGIYALQVKGLDNIQWTFFSGHFDEILQGRVLPKLLRQLSIKILTDDHGEVQCIIGNVNVVMVNMTVVNVDGRRWSIRVSDLVNLLYKLLNTPFQAIHPLLVHPIGLTGVHASLDLGIGLRWRMTETKVFQIADICLICSVAVRACNDLMTTAFVHGAAHQPFIFPGFDDAFA